jgi:hypothetical protein
MADQVVYASGDVTLHVGTYSEQVNGNEIYTVESVVLSAGDTLPLEELPPYQRESVEAGKVPNVQVVSADEADRMSAAWRDAQPNPHVVAFNARELGGPDADDGSFSDHLLEDAERVANHVERGKEEAGEAGPDNEVTVVGAEEENSPARSGRTTRATVAGEVQGTAGATLEDSK